MISSITRKQILNSSPWIFAVSCILLAIMIVVLMAQNYSREQELVKAALFQQAQAVERSIYSKLKKTLRSSLQKKETVDFEHQTKQALEEAAELAGVLSLFVVDKDGVVVVSISDEVAPSVIDSPDILLLQESISNPKRKYVFNKIEQQGSSSYFTVISDVRFNLIPRSSRMKNMKHHMKNMVLNNEIIEKSRNRYWFVMKLDLDEFNTSFNDQERQVTILLLVFALVAIGGWLSVLTLRGFKKSQADLARISAFNEQIVSSLPVGLIGVDVEGKIKLLNKSILQIIGENNSKLYSLGTNADIFWQELFDLPPLIDYQGKKEIELQLGDNTKTIIIQYIEVLKAGIPDGYVALLEDVSEQRELQGNIQKNARLASLGKMAAGVAHELRNPLSSIKGLGVLLQSRFSDGSTDKQTAQVLVDEVDRLNRSITELLDFAKPVEKYTEKVFLAEVVQKAVDLVAYDAKDLGLQFDIALPDKEVFLIGHADKLNQVFLNLLLNSMQAVEVEDNVSLSCKYFDETIEIVIADNGSGIDKKILDKVFDPYFTTKPEGTGLGLAISAKIIEEHGGTLILQSDLGKGTVATITLPKSI